MSSSFMERIPWPLPQRGSLLFSKGFLFPWCSRKSADAGLHAEDVQVNLRGAAQVVCAGYPGVWVYFNWKLIPGKRAHKARAIRPDAFTAVNGLPVFFSPSGDAKHSKILLPELHWNSPTFQDLLKKKKRRKAFLPLRGNFVGICACRVCTTFYGRKKALVLLGFGAGNAPLRDSASPCLSFRE